MAAQAEQAKSDQGGKPGLAGKILMPLLIVLNFAGLGAGAFLTFKGTLGYKPPVLLEQAALAELRKAREASTEAGFESVQYTMPVFTVDLADNPGRIIRIELTFEMLDKEGFEEIVRNSPRARDEIVRYLNKKSFRELETIQGKLALKDGIAITLNQSMKAGVIKDIYFNEFLVSNKSPIE